MARYSVTYEYVEQTQACLNEARSFFNKVVQSEGIITNADEARSIRTAKIRKLLSEANEKLKLAAQLPENAGQVYETERKE